MEYISSIKSFYRKVNVMNQIRLIIAACVLITGASCDQKMNISDPMPTKQEEITMPSAEELPALEIAAMGGSRNAAMQLSLWHMHLMQREEDMLWTKIAAENGSPVAQYNLALKLLSDQSSDLDKIRARFWLEKAAAGKHQSAKEKLNSKN
jgi:TPR repeat protein